MYVGHRPHAGMLLPSPRSSAIIPCCWRGKSGRIVIHVITATPLLSHRLRCLTSIRLQDFPGDPVNFHSAHRTPLRPSSPPRSTHCLRSSNDEPEPDPAESSVAATSTPSSHHHPISASSQFPLGRRLDIPGLVKQPFLEDLRRHAILELGCYSITARLSADFAALQARRW
jgi:hypothetical protein